MRFTLGVLVGAAVGAGTALLLAPHDGATNRQWLRNKTDELAAGESLAGALVRGAREALEVPRERIRLALEAGRQAANRREAALWQELKLPPPSDPDQSILVVEVPASVESSE